MKKGLIKKGLIKKGGSGIYLNANDKEAFKHFLLNSTATFFKTGSFGMTYVLTLNPGVDSKYLSLDASTYGMQVRQILLKTVFVYPLKLSLDIKLNNGKVEDKSTITVHDFYEEVNIQTDVYLKTMQYLEPLCPAIIYATIVRDPSNPLTKTVLNMLSTAVTRDSIKKIIAYPNIGIGLIGMEITVVDVNISNTLCSYISEKLWYESYIAKAYHTLIEFIIKTGYSHGDFHCGNLLVNDAIRNYFWGKRGKVTIIDFGFAEKLSQENYKKIKDLYDEKKYVEILSFLCDIPRKDGYIMDDWEGYTSMCLKSQPQLDDAPGYIVNVQDINNKIIQLYSLREEAINNITTTFTQKHLPLSNSAKNEMYNGVEFETKYIDRFGKVFPLRRMDQQVKKILDDMNYGYTHVEGLRLQVKSCYMLIYLLNKKNKALPDNLATRFAAMVYAGVFYDVDDVFTIVAPYVSENDFKAAIDYAMQLGAENVRFNNFLDYFTDEQLEKVTQEQLSQILNMDLWQEYPERAAILLKINANIGSITRPIRSLDVRTRFQELPFEEYVEEVVSQPEPELPPPTVVVNDGLPRPPFFDQGLQKKKKLTAGKRQYTKRKQMKPKGLSRKNK